LPVPVNGADYTGAFWKPGVRVIAPATGFPRSSLDRQKARGPTIWNDARQAKLGSNLIAAVRRIKLSCTARIYKQFEPTAFLEHIRLGCLPSGKNGGDSCCFLSPNIPIRFPGFCPSALVLRPKENPTRKDTIESEHLIPLTCSVLDEIHNVTGRS
jgi:hypothetical protein